MSKSWTWCVLAALLTVLLMGLGVVKLRYGGGSPYPDVSTTPLLAPDAIESLVQLDFPPGNVAVAPDGRTFFNFHPFAQAQRFTSATLFEWVNGRAVPFPDATSQAHLQGVFGLSVDRQGRLWTIEPAGLDHERTRLTAFDLATGRVAFEHWFQPGELQFAQDLRVTPDGQHIILADTGLFQFTSPSLVVFDITNRAHRSVLDHHPSLAPQDWVMRTRFGPHRLAHGLITFAVGVDGIEISADGQWLYYAAMTHERAFRVPLPAVLDPGASAAALAERVQDLGRKPMSDGITLDRNGNLLLTDIENGGLARLTPDSAGNSALTTLVKSPRVVWADGVALMPDDAIVFTDSAIPLYLDQLARPPALERLQAGRPYHIWQVRSRSDQSSLQGVKNTLQTQAHPDGPAKRARFR